MLYRRGPIEALQVTACVICRNIMLGNLHGNIYIYNIEERLQCSYYPVNDMQLLYKCLCVYACQRKTQYLVQMSKHTNSWDTCMLCSTYTHLCRIKPTWQQIDLQISFLGTAVTFLKHSLCPSVQVLGCST